MCATGCASAKGVHESARDDSKMRIRVRVASREGADGGVAPLVKEERVLSEELALAQLDVLL